MVRRSSPLNWVVKPGSKDSFFIWNELRITQARPALRRRENGGLAEEAHLIQRPVDKYGLAVNVPARDHAPCPAVVGRAAMIAQDEVFVFGNHADRHGTLIAKLGRHVT